MHKKVYTIQDIDAFPRRERAQFINSLNGIKSIHLIGTQNTQGAENLGLFNNVFHLSSSPTMMGVLFRPLTVPRHTYQNIRETGNFTINHVPLEWIQAAHWTSAKFPKEVSEFQACGFHAEHLEGMTAPFVAESPLQIGLKYVNEYPIEENGTVLLIGQIEMVRSKEEAIEEGGFIDYQELHTAGTVGLNTYFNFQKKARFPYAQPMENPRTRD